MARKSLKNQPYNARRCINPACGKVFQPRVYAGGLQATCDACDEAAAEASKASPYSIGKDSQ